MNAPVMLYGHRAAADVPISKQPLNLSSRDTLVIKDAEIFYNLFEVKMASVEKILPQSLHPSVPALLGITFIHANDGPLGAFDLAYVGIACRTGIKPRHLIQSAFCAAGPAADFFSSRYGFACADADVSCRETYDRVHATVNHAGADLLDVEITECVPLMGAGALIKYSPPLNAVTLDSEPCLVQFEAAYDFKRVIRGKPRAAHYQAAPLGDKNLIPTDPIAGSHAVVDLHLLPMRFKIDLSVPAEAGGASKL